MSERNLSKANEYRDEFLHQRRIEFYQFVHDRTENWVKERPPSVSGV